MHFFIRPCSFLCLALACSPTTVDTDTSTTATDPSTTATDPSTTATDPSTTTADTSSTAADTSTSESSQTDADPITGTSTNGDPTTVTEPDDTGDTSTTGVECAPDELCPDDFGFICLELVPGEGVPDTVFDGTLKVIATLHYEPCLTAFYTETHPEQSLDAPPGAAVVTAWGPRLCDEPIPGRVDCEVDAIGQSLVDPGNLEVHYNIPDAAQLNGGKLLWGPAPLPAAAECEDGLEPRARLISLDDVIGFGEDGPVAWRIQSFGAAVNAVPSLSGDDCLQVAIEPG